MARTSRNEFEDIRPFFDEAQWDELGDYEKKSYKNSKENYEAMISAGLTPRKPFFMMSHEERLKAEEKVSKPAATKRAPPAPPGEPTRKSRRVQQLYSADAENKENTAAAADGLLFCVDCNSSWFGDCPVHGAYKVLEDTKVPDDTPSEQRVEATLPAGLVVRDLESDGTDIVTRGVFAAVKLRSRTRLGPYVGDAPEDGKQPSSENNWVALVRDVPKIRANLVAVEYAGRLYFITKRTIPAGQELTVYFPRAYQRDPVCDREFFCPLILAQHQRANPRCAAELARRRRALAEKRALERSTMYAEPSRKLGAHPVPGDSKLKRELKRELVELHQMRAVEKRGAHPFPGDSKLKRELVDLDQMLAVEKLIEEGIYSCPQCGQHFGRGCRLRRHVEEQHGAQNMPGTGGIIFPCCLCKASFQVEKDLRCHVRMVHHERERHVGGPADATSSSKTSSAAASDSATLAASASAPTGSALASETSSMASFASASASTASALPSETSSLASSASASDSSSEENSDSESFNSTVEASVSNFSMENTS